jgi:hypothetical protein
MGEKVVGSRELGAGRGRIATLRWHQNSYRQSVAPRVSRNIPFRKSLDEFDAINSESAIGVKKLAIDPAALG